VEPARVSDRLQDLLFVSDLDECLVGETGYDFEPARPALAALAARRIPLVLASARTRAEMETFGRVLGLGTPLIVENGGALLVPERHLARAPEDATLLHGFWTFALGPLRAELAAALDSIAAETGANVRSLDALGAAELQRLTGSSRAAAELALQREYDEPFVLGDESVSVAMADAARHLGMRLSRRGRFWYLAGDTDVGKSLGALLVLYAAEGRRCHTVGLGAGPNDLPLLRAVDRPIVLPRAGGDVDQWMAAVLPDAEVAPAPGPAGWNAAVLAVLGGGRLPQVTGLEVGDDDEASSHA
jgi:mannosyl-3-phosphoglycerate phosphatase family protein